MDQDTFIALPKKCLEVSPGELSLTDSLDSYDWDSLAVLGFIAAVDSKFDVTLEAEKLSKATTPANLLTLVDDAVRA